MSRKKRVANLPLLQMMLMFLKFALDPLELVVSQMVRTASRPRVFILIFFLDPKFHELSISVRKGVEAKSYDETVNI